MTYINRAESEDIIRMLAQRYPKCFFEDPKLRRPLKKNIRADLQQDGIATGTLEPALEWYRSHFGYHHALQAGSKRIDLDGNEVDTVTEQEAQNAQRYVADRKREMQQRYPQQDRDVHAELRTLPMLRSRTVDVAKVISKEKQMPAADSADPFAQLQALLDSARQLMAAEFPAELREACIIHALEMLEYQAKMQIANLQKGNGS